MSTSTSLILSTIFLAASLSFPAACTSFSFSFAAFCATSNASITACASFSSVWNSSITVACFSSTAVASALALPAFLSAFSQALAPSLASTPASSTLASHASSALLAAPSALRCCFTGSPPAPTILACRSSISACSAVNFLAMPAESFRAFATEDSSSLTRFASSGCTTHCGPRFSRRLRRPGSTDWSAEASAISSLGRLLRRVRSSLATVCFSEAALVSCWRQLESSSDTFFAFFSSSATRAGVNCSSPSSLPAAASDDDDDADFEELAAFPNSMPPRFTFPPPPDMAPVVSTRSPVSVTTRCTQRDPSNASSVASSKSFATSVLRSAK
mmetsp:Transcript_27090/g.55440  ORF Transcript_27090/g.55440 Transcript_27090/m.55440 type:complete len:330 (-) Transcript_27090:1110-2099(-)